MDSLIAAAGRALAAGDALSALKRVALRNDPAALALRGIAMAQLGEHTRARDLLRSAARGFGSHEAMARARCVVAEAEVALAMRDLGGSPHVLAAAAAALQARADPVNATHAHLIAVRRLLLLGRIDEAAAALTRLETLGLVSPTPTHSTSTSTSPSPSLLVVAELAAAEIALRSLRTVAAREALQRAQVAAELARVPALRAEVDEAWAALDRPAARHWQAGTGVPMRLAEVEALIASGVLVVDACRHGLRSGADWWSLGRRPVLFALVRVLAESWPEDVDRERLIARVFRTREPDETHRARLRVEIGRLRALVAPLARIEASARGYALVPSGDQGVALLLPPIEGDDASLQALLADGTAWSTSALALAMGDSQRTVQRALVDLEAVGKVRSIGRARSQRWLALPLAGFTTILLLPGSLPLA